MCCCHWGAQTVTRPCSWVFTLKAGAALCLSMGSYHCKCEKPPWKGARRSSYYVVLFLMIGVLIFYIWFSRLLLPLTIWSVRNDTRTISPFHHLTSQFFVEYPHRYQFIVDQPNKCRQESPFLVVMIPVAPQNREARDIIRSTWGNETRVLGRLVSYYFLLGKSRIGNDTEPPDEQILLESRTHRDILQSDFLDSYKNLSIKTMVMLEWLSSHCLNSSYAMKIDSDTFLNVNNLISMVLYAPRHDYMTGLVARDAQVLRDPHSKWFLSSDVFAEPSYPPYALGLGYVFSMDLPKRILEASRHVKAVYIEDVYVGLCMKHAGVPLTDPPHNGLFVVNPPSYMSVCYLSSVIATLLQNSKEILYVWEVYKTQPQSDC
ncbi:beta-1,3-galactosyltransferase 1-like isoform 1-T2 [Fundulus diaphanus]